jgi:hypothetical protein
MADRVEVELTFKNESVEELKAILGEAGASNIEPRSAQGFGVIETVLVCFLLAEETARLVSRLVRSWKCGVVVVVSPDGKKVSAEKNCDLPTGSVLLVRPDKTEVTLQEPTEPQIGTWFKDVFGAVAGKG